MQRFIEDDFLFWELLSRSLRLDLHHNGLQTSIIRGDKMMVCRFFMVLMGILISVTLGASANSMIRGDAGNKTVADPGWPKGAAAVFNSKHRIAWYEDPPFGGGRWHAECQGDSAKLSKVLNDFAAIEHANKFVVVHDGIAKSFWLDPNREKKDDRSIETDWKFVVWQKDRWNFQKSLPRGMRSVDGDSKDGPPVELHVYTGGDVVWKEVEVPKDLVVLDQRLEAHGFTTSDGRVIQGKVEDANSHLPIEARVILELIEARSTGGYEHEEVEETQCTASGEWTLRNLRTGWYRIVVEHPGYAPRIVTHLTVDAEPGWERHDSQLIVAANITGQVVDEEAKPLQDVEVRLDNAEYETPIELKAKTNERGQFVIENAPQGSGSLWVSRDGYCRPGLGTAISIPANDVSIAMKQAGKLKVYVLFNRLPMGQYLVQIRDAAGEKVGTWGGSGQINDEQVIEFSNIPPGKYIVHGQPNPSSEDEKTEPVEVEILGGKTVELELTAKQ